MIALFSEADRTWMAHAACRGADVDMWFPERGMASTQAKALAVCDGERHGVWGGMTTEQRHRRARQREVQS